MVDFTNLINLQLQIFILIGIGYFFTKKGIITKSSRQTLTDLVINLILPCNIICSYMIEFNLEILKACAYIFVVSILIQLACQVFSKVFYPFATEEQKKVLSYATLCSNAGFMGNPLVEGIYGPQGLLYASIFLIPQRVVMWSAGVSCFSNTKGKGVLKKVLTHPCIVATFIGLFFMLTQLEMPVFAYKTLKSISGCTTTFSIIVIGSILSEFPLSEIKNKLSFYYSFIRLIVMPLIIGIICIFCKLPPLVTAVATVLVGMPAGTTTAILAEKYKGDSKLAVQLVFLSTLLSLLTIPLICVVLEMVL